MSEATCGGGFSKRVPWISLRGLGRNGCAIPARACAHPGYSRHRLVGAIRAADDGVVSNHEDQEAGGILTIDLGAIVANWRDLKARAAPAQCAAVVKADAYGCGLEPVASALAAAGCETFFVAHLAEGRRLRAVAPRATIYILNGLMPGTAPAYLGVQPASRPRQPRGARRMAGLRCGDRLAWRLRDPCGHRHEPPRHELRGGRVACGPAAVRARRHGAPDEPLGLRRHARAPAQCAADGGVPRVARVVPGRSGLARQFVWHLSRAGRTQRHGPARGLALRSQSDAAAPQSHAAGRRPEGQHRAGPRGRRRRNRRLPRDLDGTSAVAHRHRVDRLRRRLHARRQRARRSARRGSDRRRPPLPARRPCLDGSPRHRRDRPAGRRGPARRPREPPGRGHFARRSGIPCRHHRVRDFDQPRGALPPGLPCVRRNSAFRSLNVSTA